MNLVDKIENMKANAVTNEEFKSVWGISLDDHMKKMMEHVRTTDARVAKEREQAKRHE